MTGQRPDPGPAPEGCAWAAVPDDDWVINPMTQHWRCRADAGYHHRACGAPAVAQLWRKHGAGRALWAYCARHLYGRWVEDGRVLMWRLVDAEDGAP